MNTGKEEFKSLIVEFKELTIAALEASNIDDFIKTLIKRDDLIKKIVKENIEIDTEEIDYLRALEEKVIERLEAERKDIIKHIGEIDEKKRAIRKYNPKFPFPPMPTFFEKKG